MDLKLLGVNAVGEYVAELSISNGEMNPWDAIAVLLEHPIVYFCGGGVDRHGFPVECERWSVTQ
ncbi:hypothetical protein [Kordiimonas sp.]|uniref:hypothetical protein n=1 Tax=Kordiimonas sp. TaxID=1970157 RepID=UPI003A9435EA